MTNLLSDDDFRGLPESPIARFLALENLARSKLLDALDSLDEGNLLALSKQSYMTTVSVAAKVLNIAPNLVISTPPRSIGSGFDDFFMKAIETTTELQLMAHEQLNLYSVKLAQSTRQKIRAQIEIIRNCLSESSFSDEHKRRLDALLSTLETEIDRPRASLSRLMLILGLIGTVSATSIGAVADLPNALGNIATLIGHQKNDEPKRLEDLTDEIKRLPPPLDDSDSGGRQ